MADPVIVPPTPLIRQTDSPEEIARVGENVQKIFDKIAPHMGDKKPEPPSPKIESKPPDKAPEQPAQAEEPKVSPTSEPIAQEPSLKIPSFIEKALTGETQPAATPPPVVDDLPEEPPTFKTPEESKQNWRQFREKYNALKKETDSLRSRPAVDPTLTEKLTFLENQNKEMQQLLERTGVERNRIFQEKIIAPMTAAWNNASRIVHEAGGDPQALAKAMSLSGRAHYEAMDEVFGQLPESAKSEAMTAIGAYRHFDDQRRRELADPARSAAALKKAELQEQYQQVNQQQEEMKRLWDETGRILREEAKLEVMQKSSDPDAKWWNDQADFAEETGKNLWLNNSDLKKAAFAMRLAPYVDVYRRLWLTTREELSKKDKIIQEKFGSEPSLSESGGNVRGSNGPPDLKEPFDQAFLREFHRLRDQGR